MTDTDDTDELLLIPPDSFCKNPELKYPPIRESGFIPYYNIVDNLITQVHTFEDRLKSIESTSEISLINTSFDNFMDSPSKLKFQELPVRKSSSFESLSYRGLPESSQSTPQKISHHKLKLHSVPNSPNVNKFSPNRFKSPKQTFLSSGDYVPSNSNLCNGKIDENGSKMFGEIDSFISNVKTIKKINMVRNLDMEFSRASRSPKKVNREDDFEQILKEMDAQQEKIETDSKDQLLKENQARDDYSYGSTNSLYKELKSPAKNGHSLRKYDRRMPVDGCSTEQINKVHQQSLVDKISIQTNDVKHVSPTQTFMNDQFSSDSSTESSQRTTLFKPSLPKAMITKASNDFHLKAKDVLSRHQKMLEESPTSPSPIDSLEFPSRSSKDEYSDFRNLETMSLTQLWSTSSEDKNPRKYMQKLQEEKLKREHCETLIQTLQNKILDQQEKLAVAIQVDEAKDTAILRFHDAWEKASFKFKLVSKEKNQLQHEMQRLINKQKKDLEECYEKIEHYEREASKALNLAHGNQNKFADLENQNTEMSNQLTELETKLKEIETNYKSEYDKNKQLSDILANKEIELNECKNIVNSAKEEILGSKEAVEMCQKDLKSIKIENDLVTNELHNERLRFKQLQEEHTQLILKLDSKKNCEDALQKEIQQLKQALDNSKTELKNFYQGQVELVVQNKLKEFQQQLDEGEASMKAELKKRETEIATTAATHIQEIQNKFFLEIRLMDEKHQEEIRLITLKMSQYQQCYEDLQSRFQRHQDKRGHIAKQLQKLMEAQWEQAMRILNQQGGRSPLTPVQEGTPTFEQLNFLKHKSYNNVEEILNREFGGEKCSGCEQMQAMSKHSHMGKCTHEHGELDSSRESKFMIGSNTHMPVSAKTPVTSRTHAHDGQKPQLDNNLQKYVNMLLNKPPGKPIADRKNHKAFDGESERSTWHPAISSTETGKEMINNPASNEEKLRKSGKPPPWK